MDAGRWIAAEVAYQLSKRPQLMDGETEAEEGATKLRFRFGFGRPQSLRRLRPSGSASYSSRGLGSPSSLKGLRLVLTYSGLGEKWIGIPALGQTQYMAIIVIKI